MSERRKIEMDLRGIACPLSWAHARVRLDEMMTGDVLILLLDDARSLRDIPVAAEAAGYCAMDAERAGAGWRLPIEV